jgi:hypothetical protein
MSDPLFDAEDDAATPLTPEERAQLIPTYITTRAQLNEAEQLNITEADLWAFTRKRDVLSEDFLTNLHRRMFRKVWKWAGSFRTTERNIGISTGFYDPNRKMALFYWDGQKTMETVVHELAHQFFFEASSQDVALDTDNGPGFWIIEGIALYMESMSTRACGAGILADRRGVAAADADFAAGGHVEQAEQIHQR